MSLGLQYGNEKKGKEKILLPDAWYKVKLIEIKKIDKSPWDKVTKSFDDEAPKLKKILFRFELIEEIPDVDDPKSVYLVREVNPTVNVGEYETHLVGLAKQLSWPKEFDESVLCANRKDLGPMERYIMNLVGNTYESHIHPNPKGTWNIMESFKPLSKGSSEAPAEERSGFEDYPDADDLDDDFGIL